MAILIDKDCIKIAEELLKEINILSCANVAHKKPSLYMGVKMILDYLKTIEMKDHTKIK